MAVEIPRVTKRFDDYIATWVNHPLSKVCFSIEGARLIVTDITRATLPKGSGGEMIAAAVLAHGVCASPTCIRATNVLNKEEAYGRSSTALLTEVITQAAQHLGGRVTAARQGLYRDHVWVEVDVRY
jgi:hypothetical protein